VKPPPERAPQRRPRPAASGPVAGRDPSRTAGTAAPAAAAAGGAGALDWVARVQRLEAEIARINRAMRTRAVIEQAKGFLAATLSITPDAAFDHLRRLSQHENVRVVEVAARLMGAALPVEDEPAEPVPAEQAVPFDPLRYLSGPVPPAPAGTGGPVALPAPLRVRLQTAAAAIGSATDPAALAARVLEESLGWLDAESVALYVTEPDGALRMIGSAGLPAQQASDWQRIPSPVDVPLRTAINTDEPLLEQGDEPVRPGARWTERARASLPLHHDGRVVGGLTVAWPAVRPFTDAERAYLVAVGQEVERRLPRVLAVARDLASSSQWLASALDAIPAEVLLLAPVWDSDEIVDFVIDYVSPHAAAGLGLVPAEAVGRKLLDVRPALALGGVFDAYRQVARTGTPWQRLSVPEQVVGSAGRTTTVLVSRFAARLGTGLLVSWQRGEDGEVAAQAARLRRWEEFGDHGHAQWSPDGEVTWSPGLYRLLGRSPERGPVPLEQLARQVPPGDLPPLRAGLAALVEHGVPADVVFRLRTTAGLRYLKVRAAPGPGPAGGLLAQVQDVTVALARATELARQDRSAAIRRMRPGSPAPGGPAPRG